jgi:hypothetical protein
VTTFLRYRMGNDRRTEIGKFNPLAPGHPLVGEPCCVCEKELEIGQRPTLFAVGPVALDDAKKADAGYWYSALALVGHETCLWAAKKDGG